MIKELMRAAEAAESATHTGQSVNVLLRADGIFVRSRIETDYLGWSREFAIGWDEFDADPSKLPAMVQYEANLLSERRKQVPVIKFAPAGDKPAVRLIQPEEWPLAIVSALAILIAIPLGGGWLL